MQITEQFNSLVYTQEQCGHIHQKIRTRLFIAALFPKAENWKQPDYCEQ